MNKDDQRPGSLFKAIDKHRLSDDTVKQILSLIADGRLKVGDKLPSERQLVKDLGVSRVPVREALRALEARGLIQVSPGKGAFIVRRPQDADGDHSLKQWFWENRDRVLELLEVRGALEQEAAYHAAERADADDLRELETALERMQEAVSSADMEATIEHDQAFHILISRASKNRFFPLLIEELVNTLYESRKSVLGLPNAAGRSLREHRMIFEAIQNRNPKKAKEALLVHLNRVRDELQNL